MNEIIVGKIAQVFSGQRYLFNSNTFQVVDRIMLRIFTASTASFTS